MTRQDTAVSALSPFEATELHDVLIQGGRVGDAPRPTKLGRAELLAALKRAGTRHIYADSGDAAEIEKAVTLDEGALAAEVDGNTVNQPLVRKGLDRYLDDARFGASIRRIEMAGWPLTAADLVPLVYTMVCGWIGNDIAARLAAGRHWEGSLQLHMGVALYPDRAKTLGRLLRRMVPSCLVKVPFTPHAPHCLLVARDLEREGIPVNFTTTFSARQAVVAAVLADVTRTNIFLGRLNDGLQAARLGEHVDLEAQRALRRLRETAGVKTELIAASLRDWRTFDAVTGCDVFTAPCEVLREFLAQTEVPPGRVTSRLEVSYEETLGVADVVKAQVRPAAIARLYRVEPELVRFLLDLRRRGDFAAATDGEWLQRQFENAGFGDIFYAPSAAEWQQARRSKLPELGSDLTRHLPLDTHFTLLGHADFEKSQEAIDAAIAERLGRS